MRKCELANEANNPDAVATDDERGALLNAIGPKGDDQDTDDGSNIDLAWY